jgi:hypothetical protein
MFYGRLHILLVEEGGLEGLRHGVFYNEPSRTEQHTQVECNIVMYFTITEIRRVTERHQCTLYRTLFPANSAWSQGKHNSIHCVLSQVYSNLKLKTKLYTAYSILSCINKLGIQQLIYRHTRDRNMKTRMGVSSNYILTNIRKKKKAFIQISFYDCCIHLKYLEEVSGNIYYLI